MNWIFSTLRIAGASFPVSSSFVQLQAELDSNLIQERIAKLEDPISYLHRDIPELSKIIYKKLKSENSINLDFDAIFYEKYNRPLAILNSMNYLTTKHCLGSSYPIGIQLIDPTFIMYLCALDENNNKMELLVNAVDNGKPGGSLNGKDLQKSIQVPLPVINAIFSIYESKGYGIQSKEINSSVFLCNV